MVEMVSSIKQLQEKLKRIEGDITDLLDSSEIEIYKDDPHSGVVWAGCPNFWVKLDDKQKLLQIRILRDYKPWFERFRLLFKDASKQDKLLIDQTDNFIRSWVEKDGKAWVEPTIEECKTKLHTELQHFYKLLELLDVPSNPIIIPDTNAIIACPNPESYTKVAGNNEYTLILLPTVLEELDNLKVHHRDETFRKKVNSVISRIKGLRNQGNMHQGVTVSKTITVKMIAKEPDFNETLGWLDESNNDDRIIASVLEMQSHMPASPIILVTSDLNLQNKAEMASLPFAETPSE
jgi:rRNA-processing protein FCF1